MQVKRTDMRDDSPSPINREQLEIFSEGDREEEEELLQLFLEQSAERLLELRQALVMTDGDEAWRKAAHQFKGSAANLGAEALAECCRHAEVQHKGTIEQKRQHLTAINAAVEAIRQYREREYS
jgi:HPt (histidine-containing phosphotransfer) domain-containing protein